MALVDALDMFDVASAVAAGVELGRLLWIRGRIVSHPGLCCDMNPRALDQTIKAITLVLQAGNFGLVAFDEAEAPTRVLARLPFATWRRLQRIIEGSWTACVFVGDATIARSAGGLTVWLNRAEGVHAGGQLLKGLDLEIDVVCAHAQVQEHVRVPVSTHCR